MEIDDGKYQLGARSAVILQSHPFTERPQIISQVRHTSGLNAGENGLFVRRLARRWTGVQSRGL